MAARKILVMGLPGAGKTTLSKEISCRLPAVHFNADAVRDNISKDLGFSIEHRIEHARRMGWLCDRVVESGGSAIADFVCPTAATRAAFGESFIIWVDRIKCGRYEDTNVLFAEPERYDVRITSEGSPGFWAEKIVNLLRPIFDTQKRTALFVGRFQPFHDGHRRLIEAGISRVGQACIAVRDTVGLDDANPFAFYDISQRIDSALYANKGKYIVIAVPNITNIFYGRKVGYEIERIHLDPEIEAISGTGLRKSTGES